MGRERNEVRRARIHPIVTGHHVMARFVREEDGEIIFDYDMAIASNFRSAAEGPQGANWEIYDSLAGRPVLILRGALSALLPEDVAERMVARLAGDAELVVVPRVGHAPSLEEPEALAAMDRLLERVLAQTS